MCESYNKLPESCKTYFLKAAHLYLIINNALRNIDPFFYKKTILKILFDGQQLITINGHAPYDYETNSAGTGHQSLQCCGSLPRHHGCIKESLRFCLLLILSF